MRPKLLGGVLFAVMMFAGPTRAPAPLIYTPGEGWTYVSPSEAEDGGAWKRGRAKDQLDIAKAALDEEKWKLAIRAARRVYQAWPLSDYSAEALFIRARAEEGRDHLNRAFTFYQELIEDYPKSGLYEPALERQFEIANEFLDGRRVRLFGAIPTFSSMNKTVEYFEKVIENGPYSSVAPRAQLRIGEAYEKKKRFDMASDAYLLAIDRYSDRPEVEADARFLLGESLFRQARAAEFDQSVTKNAIKAFDDFIALFPFDERVETARERVATLSNQRGKGAFLTARYYEKRGEIDGALVYYNEALSLAPEGDYAERAQAKIRELQEQQNSSTE